MAKDRNAGEKVNDKDGDGGDGGGGVVVARAPSPVLARAGACPSSRRSTSASR